MEGVRGYWKRRGYRRLKASRVPRRAAATRFGCRRPRLNLLKIERSISPKMWLARLRDACVDMMLWWSSSRAFATGTIPDVGMSALGKAPLKEYEEKVIVEKVVRIPSRVQEEIEV